MSTLLSNCLIYYYNYLYMFIIIPLRSAVLDIFDVLMFSHSSCFSLLCSIERAYFRNGNEMRTEFDGAEEEAAGRESGEIRVWNDERVFYEPRPRRARTRAATTKTSCTPVIPKQSFNHQSHRRNTFQTKQREREKEREWKRTSLSFPEASRDVDRSVHD